MDYKNQTQNSNPAAHRDVLTSTFKIEAIFLLFYVLEWILHVDCPKNIIKIGSSKILIQDNNMETCKSSILR